MRVIRGRHILLALGLALAAPLLCGAQVWAVQFHYQDLGSLGGNWANAFGLNNSGQVVGQFKTSANEYHGFFWNQPAGMTDLHFTAGHWASAYGINDSSEVVGSAYPGSLYPHAFSWTQTGGMQDLQTLSGGLWSEAYAINNSGQIVGRSDTLTTSGHQVHAFLYTSAGGMQDLGTFGDSNTYSWAEAINNSGQIAGHYGATYDRAFVWISGTMTDLGTLGGNNALAYGINDVGQVVGSSQNSSNEIHAFLWSAGNSMQDLGTLGGNFAQAEGINRYGQVVGESQTGAGQVHAFFWTAAGGVQDLNTLTVNPPAGDFLYKALAINNAGQIAGFTNNGRAYLLTPTRPMIHDLTTIRQLLLQ